MGSDKATRRERNYSKRHHCTTEVVHVIKGRGKGHYEDQLKGQPLTWWKNSVTEIVATYNNGVRLP